MPLQRKLSELLLGKKASTALQSMLPHQQLAYRRAAHERSLINREAMVGAGLLGAVPTGHKRQFFCLDAHTWVWHETWRDDKRKICNMTVQYEITKQGVLKRVNGSTHSLVKGQELRNLEAAVRAYYPAVAQQVYHRQVAAA